MDAKLKNRLGYILYIIFLAVPFIFVTFSVTRSLIAEKNPPAKVKAVSTVLTTPEERKDIITLSWKYNVPSKIIIEILDAYEYQNDQSISMLKEISEKNSIPMKTIGSIIVDNFLVKADALPCVDNEKTRLKYEDL